MTLAAEEKATSLVLASNVPTLSSGNTLICNQTKPMLVVLQHQTMLSRHHTIPSTEDMIRSTSQLQSDALVFNADHNITCWHFQTSRNDALYLNSPRILITSSLITTASSRNIPICTSQLLTKTPSWQLEPASRQMRCRCAHFSVGWPHGSYDKAHRP